MKNTLHKFWQFLIAWPARLYAAARDDVCALVTALADFYSRNRLRVALTVLSVASTLVAVWCLFLSGNVAQNAASLLMGGVKLSLAVFWYFIAGFLNDFTNGNGFDDDKKLIQTGNIAVAFKRTVGFGIIYIPGCLLIAQI